MSSFKWSQKATRNLQQIAEYIRGFNPAAEVVIVGAIVERADVLREYPRIGLCREVDAAGTELRALLAGKRYRTVYEVHLNDEVEIMQVLDVRSGRY